MTKTWRLSRPSVAALVALAVSVAACTSAPLATNNDPSVGGCNALCLCIDDEATCSQTSSCLWKSGICYNWVDGDAGSDAPTDDASDDASADADASDASDDASTADAADD